MAHVELKKVQKSYDGQTTVVHSVDLEIRHGEFAVLVGPSGCGKSTLLRMIAGLETVSGGDILIDGQRVNDLPPRQRDIAMVFQDYALYPHKNLFENMAFGLRLRKESEAVIRQRVMEAAELLKIDHLLDRRPGALSGGQRQRVAIGRAIVRQPKVFLFDEPLSNLDAQLRGEMRAEIKKLHQRLGATIIYVTHDQVEAMTLADRIAVMQGGHKIQYDTPDTIYNHPSAVFVAGFTGSPSMNLLTAECTPAGLDKLAHAQGAIIEAEQGRLWLPAKDAVPDFPIDTVLSQLLQFTGTKADAHDDIVDTLSYAVDLKPRAMAGYGSKPPAPHTPKGSMMAAGGRR